MTRHIHLREWESLDPEREPQLVDAMLQTVADRELARRLARADVLEVTELRTGLRVRARAHVGRVQLGDLTITIAPKIGVSELLRLFRYAFGLRQLRLFEETSFDVSGLLLQDLLVAQLHAEVAELVRRNLPKRYVPRSGMLESPRGRIDFDALTRILPLTSARLPSRFHSRSHDHLINRVLRAGLDLGMRLAQDTKLRHSVARLAVQLGEDIGMVSLDASALGTARRQMDRMTRSCEPALRLIELLQACSAVSLGEQTGTRLRGFLFDMNRLFQALLGRFLGDHLDGFDVQEERVLTEMMRYAPDFNPRRARSPRPRPDFVVRARSRAWLLDAKYRDLWQHKLPREMLYQLAVYALSQPKDSVATILYPTTSTNASEARVEIRDPIGSGTRAWVALRPVILSEMLDAVEGDANREYACDLARKLAFG